MYRALCVIGTIICVAISAVQAEIGIKEIGNLLELASKDEGILLITLKAAINGIKKTVNEEVYESERISEAAGKCAADVGDEAIRLTETVIGNYVRHMFDKTEKLSDVLKNHTATQEELEDAKKTILSEEGEILLDLGVLRDEVLLPEAKKLSKKMEKCKELK
ncbi:hypothetical protein GE061_009171 [Apolygus lucorum]|uniref:Protein TsetseEP domain-containing protein n=1 Tax=Apolygus lucorum TaxID=248454 RepID=A0A8S9Y1J3_APOLU|nr:hypothetical protein GE061_009171 [Apolygus lucorum]